MLSRVANSLYWLSRYIERAENTARILDVNLQLLGDFEAWVDGNESDFWTAIVETTGDTELFEESYEIADAESVTAFLTWEASNPNSILSSVNAARENARMIRDQISQEMWECINAMYYFVREARNQLNDDSATFAFFQEIKAFSYRFVGLMAATYFHDDGYKFHQVGKYLERADQTSRILDLKYFLPLPEGHHPGSTVEVASWVAILRSCSAVDAFQKRHPVADTHEEEVASFLILEQNFPRSIRFSLHHLDRHLRSLSGADEGYFANKGENRVGRLLSEVAYKGIEDIQEEGLHQFIDRLQAAMIAIHQAIYETYFELPAVNMKDEIAIQQVQQVQQ